MNARQERLGCCRGGGGGLKLQNGACALTSLRTSLLLGAILSPQALRRMKRGFGPCRVGVSKSEAAAQSSRSASDP